MDIRFPFVLAAINIGGMIAVDNGWIKALCAVAATIQIYSYYIEQIKLEK